MPRCSLAQIHSAEDTALMLVLMPPVANSTEVSPHSTFVLQDPHPFQDTRLRGRLWFTANKASSNLVETPNLSKILLR